MAKEYFGEHSLRSLTILIKDELDKKVNIADIVNDLTSDATDKPLSAAQGKALSEKIEEIAEGVQSDILDSVGQPDGIAPLDENGLVPSEHLPSFVDDVIEGYYDAEADKFYEDEEHTTEIAGERGKIYLNLHNNYSYRFGGTAFVEITSTDMVELGADQVQDIWDSVFGTEEEEPDPPTPPETYTITYDPNGGTGSMSNGTATAGESFTPAACTFTPPTGKVFDYWGIGDSDPRTDVTDGHMFTAATTIYAVWKDAPLPAKVPYEGTTTGNVDVPSTMSGTKDVDISSLLCEGAVLGSVSGGGTVVETGATVTNNSLNVTLKSGLTMGMTDVVRIAITSASYEDYEITVTFTVSKGEQAAPTAAEAGITDDNIMVSSSSIELLDVPSGIEYSLDGTNWSTNPEYNDLTAGQTYTLYARRPATANLLASPTVTTQVTLPNVYEGETVLGTSEGTEPYTNGDPITISTAILGDIAADAQFVDVRFATDALTPVTRSVSGGVLSSNTDLLGSPVISADKKSITLAVTNNIMSGTGDYRVTIIIGVAHPDYEGFEVSYSFIVHYNGQETVKQTYEGTTEFSFGAGLFGSTNWRPSDYITGAVINAAPGTEFSVLSGYNTSTTFKVSSDGTYIDVSSSDAGIIGAKSSAAMIPLSLEGYEDFEVKLTITR